MKPSSTSSSEAAGASETDVPIQTALAAISVFCGVVLLYHLLIAVSGAVPIDLRPRQAIAFLETLQATEPTKPRVMVFGTSLVQFGFDPNTFDRVAARSGVATESFNFGFPDQSAPEFQEIVSRRVRETLADARRPLDLTLVEFNPFQATRATRETRSFVADQNLANLASPRDLFGVLRESPTRGVRLFAIRYIRAGMSAEMYTTDLIRRFTEPGPARRNDFEAAFATTLERAGAFRRAAGLNAPEARTAEWDVATRGAALDRDRLSPDTRKKLAALMASMRNPALLQADLERRIREADILELRLDEAYLDAFVRTVENLAAVSRHVEIVLFPRNTAWVEYSPEARARLARATEQVREQAGVPLRNYQRTPRIQPRHFSDTTHLSLADGIGIMSALLAEEYAPLLRKQAAGSSAYPGSDRE